METPRGARFGEHKSSALFGFRRAVRIYLQLLLKMGILTLGVNLGTWVNSPI